jgi:hypothetical protein
MIRAAAVVLSTIIYPVFPFWIIFCPVGFNMFMQRGSVHFVLCKSIGENLVVQTPRAYEGQRQKE